MEEYWQLNWSRREHRPEEEIQKLWNYDAGSNPTDIWNLHLSEIDPRVLSGTSKDLNDSDRPFIDPRNQRLIEHPEVNWTKQQQKKQLQLFKAFPRTSCLSRQQHMTGIRALGLKNKQILTETEQLTLLEFENMKGHLAKDREIFNILVEREVDARLRDRFTHPSEEVAGLGRQSISVDCGKYDDRWYSIQTAVTLEDTNDFTPETDLQLEDDDLKAIGVVHLLRFPAEPPMVGTLPKSIELAKLFLQKDKEITRSYNTFIGSSGRQSGGVYLTSEMIYAMLSADKNSSWTIPFLVHESDSDEQFVFFETVAQKSTRFSNLELERIGQKICYQSVVSRGTTRSYSFDELEFKDRKVELDGGKLERNGEDEEKIDVNNDDEEMEEDEEDIDSRLVIDDPEEIQLQSDETNKKSVKDPPEYKLYGFDEYLQRNVKEGHREPHNFVINRVTLRSKCSSDSLPLIVTSSCDGLYKSFYVKLSFKIEYKTEFGAQQMGLDELLREWCSIAFSARINRVVRVRIDYQTSIIMSVNCLSQEDIESEMNRLYGLKPEHLLTRVYNLVSLVTRFPAGKSYLLDKNAGNAQILIYMETEQSDGGRSGKDIVASVSAVNNSRPTFLQYPIDDQVVTQLHRMNCVLPGCIPTWSRAEYSQNKEINKKRAMERKVEGKGKNHKPVYYKSKNKKKRKGPQSS